MNRKGITILVCLLLCLCSCTPTERIASIEAAVQQTQVRLVEFEKVLDQTQAMIVQTNEALADVGLSEEQKENLQRLVDDAEQFITKTELAETQLKEFLIAKQAELATLKEQGVTGWSEVALYGSAAQQVGTYLPPPWNGYVKLAGILAGIAASVVGGKKLQRKEDDVILRDIVRSVDAAREELTRETNSKLTATLKANQNKATRDAVRLMR